MYIVAVVNQLNELNIAMFSVTEEMAMEYLDCIKNDRSTKSVEEYLEYAFNNCVGEEPEKCVLNDLPLQIALAPRHRFDAFPRHTEGM